MEMRTLAELELPVLTVALVFVFLVKNKSI